MYKNIGSYQIYVEIREILEANIIPKIPKIFPRTIERKIFSIAHISIIHFVLLYKPVASLYNHKGCKTVAKYIFNPITNTTLFPYKNLLPNQILIKSFIRVI